MFPTLIGGYVKKNSQSQCHSVIFWHIGLTSFAGVPFSNQNGKKRDVTVQNCPIKGTPGLILKGDLKGNSLVRKGHEFFFFLQVYVMGTRFLSSTSPL